MFPPVFKGCVISLRSLTFKRTPKHQSQVSSQRFFGKESEKASKKMKSKLICFMNTFRHCCKKSVIICCSKKQQQNKKIQKYIFLLENQSTVVVVQMCSSLVFDWCDRKEKSPPLSFFLHCKVP